MSIPTYDKCFPVLEPSTTQHFAGEGTIMRSLAEILVEAGVLESKGEARKKNGAMFVIVETAPGTATFDFMSTRNLMGTYEWHPGDLLLLNGLTKVVQANPRIL